jgi:hypothetical protein
LTPSTPPGRGRPGHQSARGQFRRSGVGFWRSQPHAPPAARQREPRGCGRPAPQLINARMSLRSYGKRARVTGAKMGVGVEDKVWCVHISGVAKVFPRRLRPPPPPAEILVSPRRHLRVKRVFQNPPLRGACISFFAYFFLFILRDCVTLDAARPQPGLLARRWYSGCYALLRAYLYFFFCRQDPSNPAERRKNTAKLPPSDGPAARS